MKREIDSYYLLLIALQWHMNSSPIVSSFLVAKYLLYSKFVLLLWGGGVRVWVALFLGFFFSSFGPFYFDHCVFFFSFKLRLIKAPLVSSLDFSFLWTFANCLWHGRSEGHVLRAICLFDFFFLHNHWTPLSEVLYPSSENELVPISISMGSLVGYKCI